MTEPTTKAAKSTLATNILGDYHGWVEMSWEDAEELYAAIESEAAAAERARIRAAVAALPRVSTPGTRYFVDRAAVLEVIEEVSPRPALPPSDPSLIGTEYGPG